MTEEITVSLDQKIFRFWEDLNITLSLDSIDTFSFSTPFESTNPAFRENFQPATYKPVEIRLNNEKILTGQLISRAVSLSEKILGVGGYSLPGVLNDLPVPADKYPLEFKKQNLVGIASKLAAYYNVEVQFSAPAGVAFDPAVSPEPAEKILEFLVKLANKRKLLLSNTTDGKLNFFVPGTSQVVTNLKQGQIPLVDLSVSYNEQQLYSSVTGFGSADAGRNPEKFTVKIPALKNINRPFIYIVSDVKGAELQSAVEFKAGRILAEAFTITANVQGWRNDKKRIWLPGDYVIIEAPNTFFYRETELMIRTVNLSKDSGNDSVQLELIFPGIYSGKLPEKFPWE